LPRDVLFSSSSRSAHHDLQLGACRQHVEQPSSVTEQDRDLMDLYFIQHSGLERPLRRVCAHDHHAPVPTAAFACAIALEITSVTYVTKDSSRRTGRAVGD
jgi:hypothetical protein